MMLLSKRTLTTAITLVITATLNTGCSQQTNTPSAINAQVMAEQNARWATQYMQTVQQQTGIHTTDSGLSYKIIKQGYGCQPTADSAVKVHYQAQLASNLKIIDSSYARGTPSVLPLDKMIAAWKEGIPLMTEGSTWEFYVPPQLAYGVKGSGYAIPPNSAMIFSVNLIQAGTCAHSFIRQ